MTIEKFTELTGFSPSPNYFNGYIYWEYVYSGLSEQAFCELWKHNGGIQIAYDHEKHMLETYKALYKQALIERDKAREDANNLLNKKSNN